MKSKSRTVEETLQGAFTVSHSSLGISASWGWRTLHCCVLSAAVNGIAIY